MALRRIPAPYRWDVFEMRNMILSVLECEEVCWDWSRPFSCGKHVPIKVVCHSYSHWDNCFLEPYRNKSLRNATKASSNEVEYVELGCKYRSKIYRGREALTGSQRFGVIRWYWVGGLEFWESSRFCSGPALSLPRALLLIWLQILERWRRDVTSPLTDTRPSLEFQCWDWTRERHRGLRVGNDLDFVAQSLVFAGAVSSWKGE